jgi:hypothetical protein
MLPLSRLALPLCAATLIWAWPATAGAVILSGSATLPSCETANGTIGPCTDTAYVSEDVADLSSSFIGGQIAGADPALAGFQTAFDDWNSATGDLWQLVNGGDLNLSLGVDLGLSLGSGGGGLDPVIATVSDYSPTAGEPTLSQLVWTQALFIDYTPTAGLTSSPVITLDTYSLSAGSSGSGGVFQTTCAPIPGQHPGANNTTPATIAATPSNRAYCDPIYPFQYASEYNGYSLDNVPLSTDFFFDAPAGPWPDAAFRAITLLSTVTFETDASGDITDRILTVYQGISYGFSLSVPEPEALWLIGAALSVLTIVRRTSGRNRGVSLHRARRRRAASITRQALQ